MSDDERESEVHGAQANVVARMKWRRLDMGISSSSSSGSSSGEAGWCVSSVASHTKQIDVRNLGYRAGASSPVPASPKSQTHQRSSDYYYYYILVTSPLSRLKVKGSSQSLRLADEATG